LVLDATRALSDYKTYLDENGNGDVKSLIDQVTESTKQLNNTLSGGTSGTYGNDIAKGA